ncbi:ABC transporter ATP-binding protein/permease [Bifidobacterium amazonense]|uniref:ABC transporter ATP-binding protein/permease n=1 Tax=Bifidobacterium amazonense TaxID=2809027 RepID=A0ABS9VRN7_9BIFI|nr:ABC transporter ATP-binding protein [Bifidobacterium amazonense]MCH9274772.1 ABC transporter ATP-binding protein/permease [Bifidobacterium amazonense]
MANLLLGTAVIVIAGMLSFAWTAKLAMLLASLGVYAGLKLLAFDARSAMETNTFTYRYRRISGFGDLVMDTDYETLQSVDEQTRIDAASGAVFSAGNRGLEYQINQQLRLVAWMVTLVTSVAVLGMLNVKALAVVVACNAISVAILAMQSGSVERREHDLSVRRSKQNLLSGQESDKSRGDDIVYNRLLPWLLAHNRRDTDGIIGAMLGVEGIRSSANAANGVIAFVSTLAVILVVASDGGTDMPYATLFLYVMLCMNMANTVQGAYETVRDLRRNAPMMRDWYAYVDERAAVTAHKAMAHSAGDAAAAADDGVTVTFRGIGYRPSPDSEDILHDVNLTYRSGQSIAFVGSNGAGKTTLVSVIAGLLQPTAGHILIDGREVGYDEYRAFARAHVSLLPQDNSLFSLTIADNLKLGMDASDDRIRDVLRSVGLLDKVDSLPHGTGTYLGTELDPDATQLSGGQKRSMLVARVLLHPQRICIFDEPTSAFDPVKEDEFYALMSALAGDRTLMFVSHNVGTTSFCDIAYVLDGGTVVQSGDPKRLIGETGAYRDLFAVQVTDGEEATE